MPENPDSGTPDTTPGQPTPNVGEGSAPAELEAALQKALAPFQKDLDEVKSQTRALQGDKDRGTKRVEGIAEKLLAEWEEFKKTGGTKDEFLWRKSVEDKLNAIFAPATKPVGTDASSSALSVAKAFAEAAKIEETDPDYIALTAKYMNDPQTLAKELSALVISRATKPSPTAAQSPAPAAGVSPKTDEAALIAELRGLQRYPSKNDKRIKEIETLLGW